VGAQPLSPPSTSQASLWFRAVTLDPLLHRSSYGRTTQDIDVHIDEAGIRRIAAKDPVDAQRSFVVISGLFDSELKDPPWLWPPRQPSEPGSGADTPVHSWTQQQATQAQQIVERYLGLRGQDGVTRPGHKPGLIEAERLRKQYRRQFDGDLAKQAACYQASLEAGEVPIHLQAALAANSSGTSAALKPLVEVGQRVWQNCATAASRDALYWRYLCWVLIAAGAENVTLSRLSMLGGNVNIAAESKPGVELPPDVVNRYFDPQRPPPGAR